MYINRAQNTPATLPGLEDDREVSVAELREAASHFDGIREAVGFMMEVSLDLPHVQSSNDDASLSP